jgi:hypothetical protein
LICERVAEGKPSPDQTRQADARSTRAHADAVAGQAAVRASVASIERIEQRSIRILGVADT